MYPALEDELEPGVVRVVVAVENIETTRELRKRLQQKRKTIYVEQPATDLCIRTNPGRDIIKRCAGSLRKSQSRGSYAALCDVGCVNGAEPCSAGVGSGIPDMSKLISGLL